jgi:Rrf2 family transcriptional regulator, nitric oxide-sensitive transcriptional repressor
MGSHIQERKRAKFASLAMFSRTVEYALRAVVHLAKAPEKLHSIAQISIATQVPAPYLSKVLQNLDRDGLVIVKRGVAGGYSLSKPPGKMSIFEVVQSVDPIQRIKTCPLELASHGKRLCSLHKKMDDAMANMEAAFRSTTLADIIHSSNPSTPLCETKRN